MLYEVITEGVHVSPSIQHRLSKSDTAVVVPFLLASLKRKRLRRQLVGRGQHA